jgi:DNA repair photolyase
MSVPTVDEHAWSTLEPGTAHPLQRLRAVRQLRDAGVNVGVMMAPVVPGFSAAPDQLETTIKAIAEHGAAFVGCNVMFLKEGTRDHFMGFIDTEFPEMRDGFEKLYRGPYAPAGYISSVRTMVSALLKRYDVRPRERVVRPIDEAAEVREPRPEPEQNGFEW